MDTYEKIVKQFNSTNDERFWMAAIASMVAGGILVGRNYANIIDLPMNALVNSLFKLVEKARLNIQAGARDADDVLNGFVKEFYGKFVVVRAIDGTIQATHGDRGTIDESVTKTQVMGRVEHNVEPGKEIFYIEEQTLKSFCSAMSFGYTDFKKQLESRYMVTYTRKDLLAKTKGPQMRVNTMKIVRPASTLFNSEDPVSVA